MSKKFLHDLFIVMAVVSFCVMLIECSFVYLIAFVVSLGFVFINDYVCTQNKYETRLEEMNTRLNQHILEQSMKF